MVELSGWSDIGYNWLIGEDGRVYEGRGWTTVGAHAPNYNSLSTGISFMGSYMDMLPNTAARTAAKDLINCGIKKVTMGYLICGLIHVVLGKGATL